MMLLVIAFFMVGAGAFIALEYASESARDVKANLKRANMYAIVNHREKELARGAGERIFQPAIKKMSELATRLSPRASRLELARKMQSAGVKTSPQVFLAIKGFLTVGSLAFIFISIVSGFVAGIPMGIMFGAMAFIGPDFFLSSKARKRRDEMGRMLPDTLDLLTVSVEAGLGFDSAIMKVCEKMKGPLIEELDLMAREIRIGETRRQALRNLADRSGSEDVASFSRCIIQADELGTSLGRTLRVQALDMRITRQLIAEEKAMKAPVKMLFPTVMFIFPAMFIVILGPAFIAIMASLKETAG